MTLDEVITHEQSLITKSIESPRYYERCSQDISLVSENKIKNLLEKKLSIFFSSLKPQMSLQP